MKKELKDKFLSLIDPSDSKELVCIVNQAVRKSAVCEKSHCDLQNVDVLARNLFARQRSTHYGFLSNLFFTQGKFHASRFF